MATRAAGCSTRIPIVGALLLAALIASSAVAMAAPAAAAAAPDTDPAAAAGLFRENYTKYEHRIAMRDGARLHTTVYLPKDAGAAKLYPILMNRTPYSCAPYGSDAYPEDPAEWAHLIREKFILVCQDVRGRFMSEGTFVDMRPFNAAKKSPADVDESSDTFDTIDWLVKRVPHNNGKVGAWGISYPGFYASMAALSGHPALLAVSPQAPIADWFVGDDFHHNGALFLPHAFNFYINFGKPRPEPTTKWGSPFDHRTKDGYRFFLDAGPLPGLAKYHEDGIPFWNELMAHETYDAFWQARNVRPHLAARPIAPAVLTVGGWFDAEDLFGALATYRAIESGSPRGANRLVMGPWGHGGWVRTKGDALGTVTFGQGTSEFYQREIELPFFVHYLKGGPDTKLPEAWVFETGRNEWHAFDAWPPREAKPANFYLAAGGKLEATAPTAAEAFDEYTSDPAKPVPATASIEIGMPKPYMTADQRFAARRPDVLVYQTEPLEEDLTFAGPLVASLRVSTTGTDSDFVVKVIDVYPDDYPTQPWEEKPRRPGTPFNSEMGGYQQLVRGEPFRGKFRKSLEHPEPFVPGQVETVEFTLPDVFHTFRRGHRLMVQVQSSWFPIVDRNPQTFTNIRQAKPEDFHVATQRVWRTAAAPSYLRATVLSQD